MHSFVYQKQNMLNSISYWERIVLEKEYDICVIGAGFVGLSTAYYLKQDDPALKIVVLERGAISYGASSRNAGVCCFGSVGELEDDRNRSSIDDILETVEMRYKGLTNLKSLIGTKQMDYVEAKGIELFDTKEGFEACADQVGYWNELLHDRIGDTVFKIEEQTQAGFYSKCITTALEGQINPKKIVDQLVHLCRTSDIEVHFGMEVTGWNQAATKTVSIKNGLNFHAKKIVLATNAFTQHLSNELDVAPARNQVLVTEELDDLAWIGNFHSMQGYIYFRNVGKRLLLGGARCISEHEDTYDYATTDEIMDYLERYMKERILHKTVKIDYRWSGILGVGPEKNPIIRHLGNQIYAAVRLGGMGVAIGTGIGIKMAKLIQDR